MTASFWPEKKTEWNPNQLEIQYFWPLTEQIPLELDFSECPPHQYYVRAQGIAGVEGPFNTGTVWVTAPATTGTVSINAGTGLTVESGTLTIKNLDMPWYRKLVFKLIGFKWK